MSIPKKNLISLILVLPFYLLNAQELSKKDSISNENLKFKYKQLIIPTLLIGYGVIGLASDDLKDFNLGIRNEVTDDIDGKLTIDDYSQYAPALSVYALNLCGIKGKNNLRNRSIILGTSYLLMSGTVMGLKSLTKVERPDGSGFNSFPSGHTATAFAGAEFMWQEYKDVSVWYGISGYIVATGTGFFRIYNNKHWLTDVAAGAGIGILSTKVAYWIFPYVNKHIFKSKKNISTGMIAPFYNGNQMGLGMILNLK
ncbi:phosphatase PAP2 family protein [Flavobacterium sp. N1994]|uniref:phosphatase PAP2 family protein n=1 Tax=Flavobacterium sp. N1994 TaxID=2986827 RepID=UPI00222308BE|nr:phosphatase PAP2 family protein [Flavobacterium sp. N1994]